MQSTPYDNANFAGANRQAQQLQQHQQQQQQMQANQQYSRPPVATGNARLKQDFTQFRGAFNNVVKQMASDLVASAESLSSNSNIDDSKRANQLSTEALLNDFDSAYSQLEYSLTLIHRSYVRQQQISQQTQSMALLNSAQQPSADGTASGAGSLKNVVDRLSELLKPPAHLKNALSAESIVQQYQQQLQQNALNQAALDKEKSEHLNPPSNESNNLVAPSSVQGPVSVASMLHAKGSRSSKSSASSSSVSSRRASPTETSSQIPIPEQIPGAIPHDPSLPIGLGSAQAFQPDPSMAASGGIAPQNPSQQQPPRKHLIDIGYGSDSDETDGDRRSNTPDSNTEESKLLSHMDVDSSRGNNLPSMVEEHSLSLPGPEDASMMEAKPSISTAGAHASSHIVGTNEDSIGFGSMFVNPPPAESSADILGQMATVKTEAFPFEGEEPAKRADDGAEIASSSSRPTAPGFEAGADDDEDLLSPAGPPPRPLQFPHSTDAEQFDD